VNQILRELETLNTITQHRGAMEVVDRVVLEKMSCECYRIIRGTFKELDVWAGKVVLEAGITVNSHCSEALNVSRLRGVRESVPHLRLA
jgi:hypothetical protein